MTLSLSDATLILAAKKLLTDIHPWKQGVDKDGRTIVCKFESRIAIDGALPRGVWFRAMSRPDQPESATFQLECEIPNSRSHLPLYRLEWNPISGHLNGDWGPEEWRGIFIPPGTTHEHHCFDHAIPHEDRIRTGGVHTARIIEPNFENFHDALKHACDRLELLNFRSIPDRNAQQELF